MEQINLFDLVYLREDISKPPLMKGLAGTVIYIYKQNRLFEVDFISKQGESIASVVLEHHQIAKLEDEKIKSVNEVTLFKVKI